MLDLVRRLLTRAGAVGRPAQQTGTGTDAGAQPRIAGGGTDRGTEPGADERADTGALRRRHAAGVLRRRSRLLRGPLPAHEVIALERVERLAATGQGRHART